jgi:CheY-like chemotaxis protein
MNFRGSILIVDDSAFARRRLAQQLVTIGFRVIEARDAAEAVTQFTAVAPDMVILDMVMPGCTGLELLRQLKAIDPDVCAIFATADVQQSTARTVIAAGARGLMNKPFSQDELLAAINDARCPKLAGSEST